MAVEVGGGTMVCLAHAAASEYEKSVRIKMMLIKILLPGKID